MEKRQDLEKRQNVEIKSASFIWVSRMVFACSGENNNQEEPKSTLTLKMGQTEEKKQRGVFIREVSQKPIKRSPKPGSLQFFLRLKIKPCTITFKNLALS